MSQIATQQEVEQETSLLEEIEINPVIQDPTIIELSVPRKFDLKNLIDLQDLARECINQGIDIKSKIEHETKDGQFAIIGSELFFNGQSKSKSNVKGAHDNGFYEKLEMTYNEYKNKGIPINVDTRKPRIQGNESSGLKRGKLSKLEKETIIEAWAEGAGMSIKEISRMVRRKEEVVDDVINEVRK